MKLIDTTHTLYTPEEAEAIAAEMNATDDWTYTVNHDPKGTGYSFIEVTDEDGKYITRM